MSAERVLVVRHKKISKILYHMRVYLIAPPNSPSLRRKSSGLTLLLSRSFLVPR
jgi:hypothetical protein